MVCDITCQNTAHHTTMCITTNIKPRRRSNTPGINHLMLIGKGGSGKTCMSNAVTEPQTHKPHNRISRNGIMVPISDNQINHVLPSRSDKKPKMSKPTINPAIVMDNDRLDVDTETPNVSTNTGSNG